MEKKLKPCPFCHNPNVRMTRYAADGRVRYTDRYAVLCDYNENGCGAESGRYHTPEEAAEMWNRRKRRWDG